MNHKHLIAQGNISCPPQDCSMIEQWMSQLINNLGMIAIIHPQAAYCETVGNRGVTCICAIATSHIVLHVWDESEFGSFQLDVYTCSELCLDIVWNAIKEFRPFDVKYKFYDRESGFSLLEESL